MQTITDSHVERAEMDESKLAVVWCDLYREALVHDALKRRQRKLVCIVLLLALFAVSCGSRATVTPSPHFYPSPTRYPILETLAVSPTQAPPPTATPTPQPTAVATIPPKVATRPAFRPSATPTSFAPLTTNGPYLVYIKNEFLQWSLVIMDADGKGRKTLPLPGVAEFGLTYGSELSSDGQWFVFGASDGGVSDGIPYDFTWYLLHLVDGHIQALNHVSSADYDLRPQFSPDGKWLSFFTGSPGAPASISTSTHYTLVLNLLRLSDGQIIHKLNLLSADYPRNLYATIDFVSKLSEADQKLYIGEVYKPSAEEPIKVFIRTIGIHAWSPDGRYLAFAGEQDGPSSDVYLYEPETLSLRRLTDGPTEVRWIEWSPDGERIFHRSGFVYACLADCDVVDVAYVDGRPVHRLQFEHLGGGPTAFTDWLTPSSRLLFTAGWFGFLRYMDVDTGRTVELYPHYFGTEALELETLTLLVSAPPHPTDDVTQQDQLVLFDLRHGSSKSLTFEACPFPDSPMAASPVKFGKYRFSVSCDNGTALVAPDGSLAPLNKEFSWVSAAPNAQWLVTYDPASPYATLMDSDPAESRQIDLDAVEAVTWRPDSQGLFIVTKTGELYYVAVADAVPIKIDQGVSQGVSHAYFPVSWINAK